MCASTLKCEDGSKPVTFRKAPKTVVSTGVAVAGIAVPPGEAGAAAAVAGDDVAGVGVAADAGPVDAAVPNDAVSI